jgi:hypothetical protein
VTEADKTQITIKLVRAVARVDIGVGQVSKLTDTDYRLAWNGLDDNGKVIPFVPTEIYIARPGSVISLLPSRANMNSESKIVTPTIHVDNELFPAGKSWTKFAYTFGGKKFSTQEIYIP